MRLIMTVALLLPRLEGFSGATQALFGIYHDSCHQCEFLLIPRRSFHPSFKLVF